MRPTSMIIDHWSLTRQHWNLIAQQITMPDAPSHKMMTWRCRVTWTLFSLLMTSIYSNKYWEWWCRTSRHDSECREDTVLLITQLQTLQSRLQLKGRRHQLVTVELTEVIKWHGTILCVVQPQIRVKCSLWQYHPHVVPRRCHTHNTRRHATPTARWPRPLHAAANCHWFVYSLSFVLKLKLFFTNVVIMTNMTTDKVTKNNIST